MRKSLGAIQNTLRPRATPRLRVHQRDHKRTPAPHFVIT